MPKKIIDSFNEKSQELNKEIIDSIPKAESGNVEVSDKKKEQSYQEAVNLMQNIRSMTASDAKMDMYQKLMKQFYDLSGYKDADQYAKECSQKIKKTNDEITKTVYKRAQYYKRNAKLAKDFKSAAEEFMKVSGYRDADEMALQCSQLGASIEKKAERKRLAFGALVLLCVAAVIFAVFTPYAKYILANAYMGSGSYPPAISLYHKLGSYGNSTEKLTECQYLRGLELETDENYTGAEIAFAAAGNYKDSEEKLARMRKLIIKNSAPGDTVKLGYCKWVILDAEDNKVLLMKKTPLSGMAYHDEFVDVTWEKSSLRQYLNSEFIENTFTETEQKDMILIDVKNSGNAVYGTDGGYDTKDYVYLLSVDEAVEYHALFLDFKSSSWLRTPGYSQNSAAFLSMEGSTMDYGYAVNSGEFTVRPVLWFNLDE